MNVALLCGSLIIGTGLIGCGSENIGSTKSRSAKKADKDPESAESDDALEQDSSTSTKDKPEEKNSKTEDPPNTPAPENKAPKVGWLDPALGFRFMLIDETPPDWEKADVESEEMTLYIDMTPQERKDALAAQKEQTDTILSILTAIYPAAAGYISIGTNVLALLEKFGVDLDSTNGDRRPSICERKLGTGWHFPREEMLHDAIEDEILTAIPGLKDKTVWVTEGTNILRKSFRFPTAEEKKGLKQTEFDNQARHNALCIKRDLQ